MDINKISLQRIKLPLKSSFETSFGKVTEKDIIIVKVHGGDKVGFAESVAMPFPIYNEETTGTVWHMLETYLIPKLLENEIKEPKDFSELFSYIRRNNMAKAALEMAIWDLYSKQKGQTLSTTLGGKRSEIEVGVSIGIENNIETLLNKVAGFLEDGYKKIKVKIKPGWDIKPLEAIRKKFGEQIPLMADANSCYSLNDLQLLQELDQFNLMMVEQPLAHDDIIDHAKLQNLLTTPICLDESIHSLEDARKAIEINACKIINIKVGRVGGLFEAIRMHNLCEEKNIPVWCGGMLEAGIGRAHNIAIASLSNFSIPGDTSASSRYFDKDIILPEVKLSKAGTIIVPEQPGIGFEVNQEFINQLTVTQKEFIRDKIKFY
ncbi:o-succinylbenzoate synthase [Lysinibacillus fusiformis]|uniref:o-succinylbenzoate synthase n=1 Tax=Lysinibacillus fusiformis TaxID=28031 RepID=A0A1H9KIQ0_9BACI|nr:o-succinylbenzoate synthase [Lysinibacillus fusiformis]MCG7436528.1 o-succinylbenzoate synthase [Lysinibacillus fusiformis]NOG26955.1 o-succinylbenzoate synthase [Lysinibacillus fusiformis]SCY50001.1 O-succinylbenzoate synthase [Lysinibacillus fusiformis]SEN81279.1 O-succinylbenzoate synthase [Lysinibacillus fusiformis]SEQ98949.1 O-succinylbenzoate synthase [Lysinibacillus fusiformis]